MDFTPFNQMLVHVVGGDDRHWMDFTPFNQMLVHVVGEDIEIFTPLISCWRNDVGDDESWTLLCAILHVKQNGVVI